MNPILRRYFDAIEARLIESPAVASYRVLRQEIASADGKLRAKAAIHDGGRLEFFIYVAESGGQIQTLKYSFHWQGAEEDLKRRWDNAPHYPNLPNAPHHVHGEDGQAREGRGIPDLFSVLDEIESALKPAS